MTCMCDDDYRRVLKLNVFIKTVIYLSRLFLFKYNFVSLIGTLILTTNHHFSSEQVLSGLILAGPANDAPVAFSARPFQIKEQQLYFLTFAIAFGSA